MNLIKKLVHTDSVKYVLFAFAIALIAFFAILPLASDFDADATGPSFMAGLVAAFGGDGGGDGGGGGDSGAGCCGDVGGDTGTGDGGGEPPTPVLPLGHHDGAEGTKTGSECIVYGWAYDPKVTSSIDVHIYVDGPYTSGTIIGNVRASEYRSDVCTAIPGASCNTGFKMAVPEQYRDGRAHTYYAYAINSDSAGQNVLLQNSPRVLTCAAPAVPAPTCTLDAAPTSITQGSASNLSWTTQNATSVSINQGVGTVALNGSKSVSPSNSTTYTLTATGAGGTVTCAKTVTVTQLPSAPACTLTASPTQLPYTGGSVLLTWTTDNATNVSINNNVGAVSLDGSRSVVVGQNTTFVLTASGAGGTVTCSKSITVAPAPQAPTCALDASPTQINLGGSATITWNTTNASSVTLNEGIGSVSVSGSRTVSPSVTKTYSLTATGAGGTVICSKTITVVVPPSAPTCTLTASPASITRGQSATLTWSSTNGTAAVLNNSIGAVALNGTRAVSPTVTTEYVLSVVGDGGNVLCKTTVTVNEPPAAPTCTLNSDRTTIVAGESVRLTWNSTNGSTATLQGVNVALSGSNTYTPATNTTYTFIVSGPGGNVTCTKAITVTPYVPVAPTCTLAVNPNKVIRGQSAALTWTTANATAVSIDQNIGTVSASGTRSVSPTQTTTYTLTATGEQNKTVTCVASLVVESEPEPTPLTCDAFTASPSTLNAAGTTTLTWNTTNATGVSINQGVGTTTVDGSKQVYVDASKTFTLTATDGDDVVTCQAPVTINPVVIVPKCDAFTVSPTSVNRGENVTLSWNTTNATAVSINNGIGTVAVDGTATIAVNADTTYTLTASNGSASDSCQSTVTIKSSGGGGGGGSSSPRCTLTASDKTIKAGDTVTLTWKNLRTNDILLKDNRGNVLVDSKKDSKIDEDEGSIKVKPTKSTSYTLTAIRGSKDRECTVDINVSNVTVSSTRSQDPLVAGISLSKLPYTGFDAGPVLTTIFYALIALWGIGIGYVLVMKQGNGFSFSLPALSLGRTRAVGHIVSDVPMGATPDITSPIVRESIMGSAYVQPVQAPYALPVAEKSSVVGYEALYETPVAPVAVETVMETPVVPVLDTTALAARLEARAHDAQILMSPDALNFILTQTTDEAACVEILDMIIDVAKATYPKEDGWIAINKERILGLVK